MIMLSAPVDDTETTAPVATTEPVESTAPTQDPAPDSTGEPTWQAVSPRAPSE